MGSEIPENILQKMYHSKRRELKQLQRQNKFVQKISFKMYLPLNGKVMSFFHYLGIGHILNNNLTRFLTFLNINLEFGQFL